MVCLTLPQHWKTELEKPNARIKVDISIQAPQDATAGLDEPSIKSGDLRGNAAVFMPGDFAEDPKVTRKESEDMGRERVNPEHATVECETSQTETEDGQIPLTASSNGEAGEHSRRFA